MLMRAPTVCSIADLWLGMQPAVARVSMYRVGEQHGLVVRSEFKIFHSSR
jgi:hypothetical protein